MPFYLYSAAWAISVFLLYRLSQRNRSKLPLPPGPRKLPLVGNLFDMPSTFEWETYMEWSKKYNSDIIHLNVVGTSIIVLSSAEAANDLLEKRSSLYSDRARSPMVNELMGWTFALGFIKYGMNWQRGVMTNDLIICGSHRRSLVRCPHQILRHNSQEHFRRSRRRLLHQAFNATASQEFRPKEILATHELLRRILQEPGDVMDHLRHMAGEVIMSVAYGIDVLPSNDPYIALAKEAVRSLSIASVPGRFLVDSLPILKYVPDWFPGAGFKQTAKEWNKLARAMVDVPFAEAKRNIAAGNAPPSFTSNNLRNLELLKDSAEKEEKEQAVKDIAGNMYTAGADTTVSALATFVLAMIANPDAQKKAQAEIDSVVGTNRLPDFDDESSLPYVSAVVKEVLRWRSVTPIAIPHFLPVEDEYRGYRLPAGSIVIPNAWAILHDEVMYPDPYRFNPDRFLLDGKPNPAVRSPDAAFGFGRRVCPGRYMAASSVWISAVSILATFDITKAVGDDGQVIEPSYEYFPALVSMPLPFKCSIKPRSQCAVDLIQAVVNAERSI
ncbi:cytochrome P450 [Mycena sp. CBHHK59/15]|nr:cytochrome P450 [Mycena sp. CBHHK59/15]